MDAPNKTVLIFFDTHWPLLQTLCTLQSPVGLSVHLTVIMPHPHAEIIPP